MTNKFLVDSNVFIAASRLYYAFDIAPSFWIQFKDKLLEDNIVVIDVVKRELDAGNDALTEWVDDLKGINILSSKTANVINNYAKVIRYVAESDKYKKSALDNWSSGSVADPWLIAVAMDGGYTIITNEKNVGHITNPSKNAKIPDVAQHFGVNCINVFDFMRIMKMKL